MAGQILAEVFQSDGAELPPAGALALSGQFTAIDCSLRDVNAYIHRILYSRFCCLPN